MCNPGRGIQNKVIKQSKKKFGYYNESFIA